MGNWKEAAEGQFPTYPEGTYKVELTKWSQFEAKTEKKTTMLSWVGKILEPKEISGEQGTIVIEGKPISAAIPCTESTFFRVAQWVRDCGFILDDLPNVEVNTPAFFAVLNACVGRTMYWVMKTTPGRDKPVLAEAFPDSEQEFVKPVVNVTKDACPF